MSNKVVSIDWVLNLLAGMTFPEQGGAYDFVKKAFDVSKDLKEVREGLGLEQKTITHEEALNKILSQDCGRLDTDELKKNGGVQEFHLELHCARMLVKARYLGNLRYEIVSVEKVSEENPKNKDARSTNEQPERG